VRERRRLDTRRRVLDTSPTSAMPASSGSNVRCRRVAEIGRWAEGWKVHWAVTGIQVDGSSALVGLKLAYTRMPEPAEIPNRRGEVACCHQDLVIDEGATGQGEEREWLTVIVDEPHHDGPDVRELVVHVHAHLGPKPW
jgi:hypothetical protein